MKLTRGNWPENLVSGKELGETDFVRGLHHISVSHEGSMVIFGSWRQTPPGCFHYAKDCGNFGRNSDGKVRFGFFCGITSGGGPHCPLNRSNEHRKLFSWYEAEACGPAIFGDLLTSEYFIVQTQFKIILRNILLIWHVIKVTGNRKLGRSNACVAALKHVLTSSDSHHGLEEIAYRGSASSSNLPLFSIHWIFFIYLVSCENSIRRSTAVDCSGCCVQWTNFAEKSFYK